VLVLLMCINKQIGGMSFFLVLSSCVCMVLLPIRLFHALLPAPLVSLPCYCSTRTYTIA